MAKRIPLIMDCDPGLDDAVEILFALASQHTFDILGITTVVGNGSLKQGQENARRICEIANQRDMKVFAGCPRTFFQKLTPQEIEYVEGIHGETGLGGCKLPPPTMPLQEQHAVNFIIETLMNAQEKVTLSLSGPLTNMACALVMEPRIIEKVEKVVLMGGVIGLGNITPAAEYNFYCDPHAASIVFNAGLPITMIGLDVTRQIQATETWLKRVEALKNPVSQAVIDMLSYYLRPDAIREPEVKSGVLHDPNIIGYLLKPELYKGRDVYVEIDVSSTITSGRSTVDWYKKVEKPTNAFVLNEVDVEGFFDLLTDRLARYPLS